MKTHFCIWSVVTSTSKHPTCISHWHTRWSFWGHTHYETFYSSATYAPHQTQHFMNSCSNFCIFLTNFCSEDFCIMRNGCFEDFHTYRTVLHGNGVHCMFYICWFPKQLLWLRPQNNHFVDKFWLYEKLRSEVHKYEITLSSNKSSLISTNDLLHITWLKWHRFSHNHRTFCNIFVETELLMCFVYTYTNSLNRLVMDEDNCWLEYVTGKSL